MGSRRAKALTPKMMKVLQLIFEGKSDKQISLELGISEGNAKGYANRLRFLFDADNRTELCYNALKAGLLKVPKVEGTFYLNVPGGRLVFHRSLDEKGGDPNGEEETGRRRKEKASVPVLRRIK
jgi:DNA-binding CsgD family transcriptional regulator